MGNLIAMAISFIAGAIMGGIGIFLTFKDIDMISALESENRILKAEIEEIQAELLPDPKMRKEI